MSNEIQLTEIEKKEIWERITCVEASDKSAHKRIDKLDEILNSVNNLAISISQIASETKALREDFTAVVKRIQTLESVPKKRYDIIVAAIITAIVGGLTGYLFSILLK